MAQTNCCLNAFEWDGSPCGTEGKLANNDSYITGQNPELAILLIHDAFGWKYANIRLLADHYAREINATVYVPDFFGGGSLPFEPMFEGRFDQMDLVQFNIDNARHKREPEVLACAKALRQKHKHLAAVGFCYGGWGCFFLGAKKHEMSDGRPLVDCISVGHPSYLTTDDIDNVIVPVQLLIPEFEPAYSPALQAHTFATLPKLGLSWDFQYFPGVEHGALSRGNENKIGERRAMERAKTAVVKWVKTFASE
ncbi:Alpha/Beta hydrolase protein [Ilyonectria sp. MPI-CAGE-AT-0026]|nr:Alpha/Beta hydrolase protein [Ilyonectria sp. MPI-CAGE-AT-0026]